VSSDSGADVRALKVLETVDKPPMSSKKFIFAIISQVTWKAWLFYAVYADFSATAVMAAIAAAGTIEAAIAGVQAWHDREVKVEQLRAIKGAVVSAPTS